MLIFQGVNKKVTLGETDDLTCFFLATIFCMEMRQ